MSDAGNPATIEPYLRYVGLRAEELAALKAARDAVEAQVGALVESFHAHITSAEETRAFIADEAALRRLLAAQRRYLLSWFEGGFDTAYFEQRRSIGRTHYQLGLSFRWYVGAYTVYEEALVPLLRAHFANDAAAGALAESALRKVMLLDMAIVLDAHHAGDEAALEAAREKILHQEKLAAVGLLASGLAHEVGNPLASIQAVCDNQLRKNLEPQIADKFQRIRTQVERIVVIVRQLVSFARPVSSTAQAVNLNEVIDSALAIARLSRSAKPLVTLMHLDPHLPATYGVADQLAQVFLNLFLNAIDAMQDQGGELLVRSGVSSDQQRIVVSVEDNGCGIAPEYLKRIFTPFFTTKEVGKGTGLGLHVSDGIVKRHGGTIRVRSVPGQGSIFTVELPLYKEPAAEKKSA